MIASRKSRDVWPIVIVLAIAGIATPVPAVDVAHDVVPVLRVHCGKCHTGDARQGGFSLNTRETMLAGGDSGTAGFVAGKSAESEIIDRIVDGFWQERGIAPPPRCDDRTFIRRVSLDLVGLLPDPDRVERFVADTTASKRPKTSRESRSRQCLPDGGCGLSNSFHFEAFHAF
jgi:hypothetical protein